MLNKHCQVTTSYIHLLSRSFDSKREFFFISHFIQMWDKKTSTYSKGAGLIFVITSLYYKWLHYTYVGVTWGGITTGAGRAVVMMLKPHILGSSSELSAQSLTRLHRTFPFIHAPYAHWKLLGEHFSFPHVSFISSEPSKQSTSPLHLSNRLMHSPFLHSNCTPL